MKDSPERPSAYELCLLGIVVLVLVWSGINPRDRFTWVLEVFPVIVGLPLLIYVYPHFRFTPLVCTLMAVHAVILMADSLGPAGPNMRSVQAAPGDRS